MQTIAITMFPVTIISRNSWLPDWRKMISREYFSFDVEVFLEGQALQACC